MPATTVDATVAADYLGCTPAWLAGQARAGRITSYKVGRRRRYRLEDLDAYLATVREGDPSGRIQRRRSA
jgi:excisionase family DNA binding protein